MKGKITTKERTVNKVVLLDVNLIYPNPSQPRVVFQEEELRQLSESIAENGLLQPLTVRNMGRYYELIAGERRLRALRLAKINQAPCIVIEASERQSAVFALLENIQRSDLNYFEEAVALKNLMVEWGLSQQELGSRFGMAQSTIANKLRLLKFDETIQSAILKAGLNERQARALLRLEDPKSISAAVEAVSSKKLNVAQTERYVDSLLQGKHPIRLTHPIVKDVRLFFNTINRAISVMKESGIPASAQKIEKEDCIEYIVKIPMTN